MSSKENIQLKNSARHHILYDAALIEHPGEALFCPELGPAAEKAVAVGRGEARFYQYQGHDLVLKQYLRGGMVANLLGDRYFGINPENTRSFKEFYLLNQMQKLDLPAPKPVAASAERSGLFFRAALITLEIPDAQTLADQLMQAALDLVSLLKAAQRMRTGMSF